MTDNAGVLGMVKRHRRAAIFGGSVGLILLVAAVGYEFAMTPARPHVAAARAGEVVAYIGDPRGLAALPQVEQHQFLDQWKAHVAQEPHKSELRDCFKGLADDDRRAFAETITRLLKRSFLEDAQRFARLASPQEKSRFVRAKVVEYRDQALFMKDVAVGFKNEIGRSPDDVQKYILEHTTAEERAIGEPYVDALKRVRDQLRKEERAAAPPASSASAAKP